VVLDKHQIINGASQVISLCIKIYHDILKYKKNRYLKNLQKTGLQLGKNVWIVDDCFLDSAHCYLISIGDNTTICPNVRLIAHDASTKKILGYVKFGRIDIKENCFIGDSTIILPNVTIGANSIIGSGSVVTKSVPPNTVAAGNPAKYICSIEDYTKKMEGLLSNEKKLFGRGYYIENLTPVKRNELIAAAESKIGFIV
jgi:maltose O-acetyltransferase